MKNTLLPFLMLLPLFANAQTVGFQRATQAAHLNHLFQTPEVMGGGVAFFDYNNDDFEDIYLTGGDLPDQLFKNKGNGTFENVTEASGIYHPFTRTMGVVTGDLDNDGFRDIIVTTNRDYHSLLYRNNGDGTFTDITWESGIYGAWDSGIDENRSFSAALGDVNLDGFLDVYICNWVAYGTLITDSVTNEVIGFDYHGGSNRLYINNGDMTFSEVSNVYGVIEDGCSLAAVFSDYDNDRDMDLLVANDFGMWDKPDALYRNDFPNVPFADESENSGFDTKLFGMGIAVGDYDRDGDLDYYKTSIGAAVLMQNQMDGSFNEVAENAGVADTYVGGEAPFLSVTWGAGFADFDNDAWLDLAVAKGRVGFPNFWTSLDSMPDQLWRNLGDGNFEDARDWFDLPNYQMARGLAYADYDNDGDVDLLFANSDSSYQNVAGAGSPVLYQNILSDGGNWLKVKTVGTVNNRDGFGTHLRIFVNGASWLHEIGSGGQGHNSQHSSIAHFGLSDAEKVDSLLFSWPGNLTPPQVFYDIPANLFIEITEAEPEYVLIQGTLTATHESADFQNLVNLSVFPNPISSDELTLYLPESNPEVTGQNAIIRLYDQTGRLALQQTTSSQQQKLNVSQLAAGIYFVEVTTGGKVFREKVVVE